MCNVSFDFSEGFNDCTSSLVPFLRAFQMKKVCVCVWGEWAGCHLIGPLQISLQKQQTRLSQKSLKKKINKKSLL